MSDHDDRSDREAEHPDVLEELSDTAQRFLTDPDLDAANERDLPDDATGEEVPQDGDPGR